MSQAAERYRRMEARRFDLLDRITDELQHGYKKHGSDQWGRHEFYGVLKEEVDELWDAIKTDQPQSFVEDELVQVVAVCFRYYETRDRYREPQQEG
jgi:NTP pyrophosphatase (non-canonical NTP hydrolase)